MSWMAWTFPTAMFFAAIGIMLVLMTVWELRRPTRQTQGFLPLATTRGDRLFIALLSAAFIHLLWLATVDELLPVASVLSVAWAMALMRWG
jgi:predicted small integral membrane protein